MNLFMLLLSVAIAQPAERGGSEPRLSAQYERCMASGDAARGVTAGMMDCLGAENTVQDRRLNRTYQALMQRLPRARRDQLRRSQRLWLQERERTCGAESEAAGGGTLSAVIFSSCFATETARRTQWLERQR